MPNKDKYSRYSLVLQVTPEVRVEGIEYPTANNSKSSSYTDDGNLFEEDDKNKKSLLSKKRKSKSFWGSLFACK